MTLLRPINDCPGGRSYVEWLHYEKRQGGRPLVAAVPMTRQCLATDRYPRSDQLIRRLGKVRTVLPT
jgi:hypothetical protein